MQLKNGNLVKLVDTKLLDKLVSIAGHEKNSSSLDRGKTCLKQFNKNLGKQKIKRNFIKVWKKTNLLLKKSRS